MKGSPDPHQMVARQTRLHRAKPKLLRKSFELCFFCFVLRKLNNRVVGTCLAVFVVVAFGCSLQFVYARMLGNPTQHSSSTFIMTTAIEHLTAETSHFKQPSVFVE